MHIDLLIFDWDGTLMDSTRQIVAAMQAAARDLGLPGRSERAIQDIIGLGLKEAMERLYPALAPDRYPALLAAYRRHWFGPANDSRLFPGAGETLQRLHRQGYLLAVATGKGRPGLDRVLAETGLAGLFAATRCADETLSKPDPRMVQEILALTGTPPERALVIGDTEHDMRMACNAGVARVAATYGVHDCDRLRPYRPLVCLDDITELPAWLADTDQSGRARDGAWHRNLQETS